MTSRRRDPWVVRTGQETLDARLSALSRRLRHALQILDGYCRERPYCWIGNAEWAAAYGCKERNGQVVLADMEKAGLIRRVLREGTGKTKRFGIIMLRRADPDKPCASSEEEIRTVTEDIESRKTPLFPEAPRAQKSAPSRAQKSAPSRAQKSAPGIKTESSSKKEALEIERPGADDSGKTRPTTTTRDRPPEPTATSLNPRPVAGVSSLGTALAGLAVLGAGAPPTPPATPAAAPRSPAPPRPAAAPEADGLTRGQHDFLAGLSPEDRAAMEALDARVRVGILAGFRFGEDRAARAEFEKTLRARSKGPPPPADAPTEQLIGELAGRWGAAIVPRVCDAIIHAIRDKRDKRTFRYWAGRCQEIVDGQLPPDSLLVPYRKMLAKVTSDKPPRNIRAYLVESVKNWRLENAPS